MNLKPLSSLVHWLNNEGFNSQQEFLLKNATTFQLGGKTPLFISVEKCDPLVALIKKLSTYKLPYTFIGEGSNLLISDRGTPAIVIAYKTTSLDLAHHADTMTLSGATRLDDLAAYFTDHALNELVLCSGIPGTLGGAVVGNAGAFGWQIGDCIESVTTIDRAGNLKNLSAKEMRFNYRESRLKRSGEFLLSATCRITKGDPHALSDKREEILTLRREKHPSLISDPSAGSFFKNIEATSKAKRRQAAGYFLEAVHAKEMHVGGAAVYKKHANIIIKKNESCTAQDVYNLHLIMKQAVLEKFKLPLQPEVQFMGKF